MWTSPAVPGGATVYRMSTFQVDDVASAKVRLPTASLASRHGDALAIGGDPEVAVIDHGTTHPLLAAVGIAFAQHRPLVLTPDAVWLTIAQGVAQHIRSQAESLRPRLVRHAGRKKLIVHIDGAMPTDAASWAGVIAQFRGLLAEEIGDGRARLFECDFSTSSDVDRLASQVILLDAYSPYFSYWMMCICGIPSITLTGTPADWRRIRERVDVIAELGLEHWCRSLRPILDQFVRAAEGKIDVAFWKRIYNPVDAYGGEMITGWITRLYPYIKTGGTYDTPNPMLDQPLDKPDKRYGLSSNVLPNTTSRVNVHVVDQVAGEQRKVALVAGVVAVAQDDNGALRPFCGWHLEPAVVHIDDVVDRIVREHHTTPSPERDRSDDEGTADTIALYGRIGTATLFAGEHAWHFRPSRKHTYTYRSRLMLRRIADLPDGRSLCVSTRGGRELWVAARVTDDDVLDEPAQIRVLGSSLTAILDAALDCNGDIDHLTIGTLAEMA